MIPPEFRHAVVARLHAAAGGLQGIVDGIVQGVHLDVTAQAQGAREAGHERAVGFAPVALEILEGAALAAPEQIDESDHGSPPEPAGMFARWKGPRNARVLPLADSR